MLCASSIMGLSKLDLDQQSLISGKITELKELNQKAIAKEAKAYMYDWQQLDRYLTEALLKYRHILFENKLSY